MDKRERTMLTMLISDKERDWLDRLVEFEGEDSKSAYIRRLIRREAQRLNIAPTIGQHEPEGEPVAA